MSSLRIFVHLIKKGLKGFRKCLFGLLALCTVYIFVYYLYFRSMPSVRYHGDVQRNTEIYYYGSHAIPHTLHEASQVVTNAQGQTIDSVGLLKNSRQSLQPPTLTARQYESVSVLEKPSVTLNLSERGTTKGLRNEAMNIVNDPTGLRKTTEGPSLPSVQSLVDSPARATQSPQSRTYLSVRTNQDTAVPRETLPQVLILHEISEPDAARSVQVLLESQRVGVTLYNYWKRSSHSLTTERNGKRVGSYSFVILVDIGLHFELWSQSKSEPLLDYCWEYRVPLLILSRPSRGSDNSLNLQFGEETQVGTNIRARSVRSDSALCLELNSLRWLYYAKPGLRITKFPDNSVWTVFHFTQQSPDSHVTTTVNHTKGHVTSAPNQTALKMDSKFVRNNFEVVLQLSYMDSKTERKKKAPLLIKDGGLLDGVKKVYFGGPTNYWLTKLLLLDVMKNMSNQQMFRFGRRRWLQVDIDDIFVGPNSTKMTTEDVKVLIETQQRFRSNVPGMTFNLGFSGQFFSRGTEADVEGNKALIGNASRFWWFGHIFNHAQPHLASSDHLKQCMTDNVNFAKAHSLPAFTTHYTVSPHHSGVYPVYQPLYDAWRHVWNVSMTTTEEYPHLRPDHMRRGFIHSGIMVLPRQTCRLFTHTYRFSDFHGGREGLLALAEGGEVFSTLLNNPVSIFMTHVMNYAHDRLALVLFDALLNFVHKFTQLELVTDRPLVLGKKYFELFPEEKLPIWTSPCADKRHLEIWPPSEDFNCSRLPSLLILGPQKSGTTALHSFLGLHPALKPSVPSRAHFEEVQFFSDDSLYQKGPQWYMDQFPFPQSSPSPLLLFEKSATYLTHPLAPLRAHSLLPEAKLVVILHDPVQRAYSWYQHARAHGDTTALRYSFSDVIRASTHHPAPSDRKLVSLSVHCLEPGIYHQHLDRWLVYYRPDQLLLLDGGELASRPTNVLQQVEQFLRVKHWDYQSVLKYSEKKGFYCASSNGRPHCLGPGKGRKYEALLEKDSEVLEAYYGTHNNKLMELLRKLGRQPPSWLIQQQ